MENAVRSGWLVMENSLGTAVGVLAQSEDDLGRYHQWQERTGYRGVAEHPAKRQKGMQADRFLV